MELRKFTAKGLRNFKNYYLSIYDNGRRPDSFDSGQYLTDEHTIVIDKSITLPDGPFENRYFFGDALCHALGRYMGNLNDIEMWSWLSVYYFDEICKKSSGEYNLGAWQTVVLDLNSRRKYRHKVFAPAYFVYAYGEASAPLLCKHLNVHGQVFEDYTGTTDLMSIAFLSITKKLGYDEEKNDWKPAFNNHRNTKSLNKYRILLKQLAVNNFILDCETPESIEALIEKFPENQKPD